MSYAKVCGVNTNSHLKTIFFVISMIYMTVGQQTGKPKQQQQKFLLWLKFSFFSFSGHKKCKDMMRKKEETFCVCGLFFLLVFISRIINLLLLDKICLVFVKYCLRHRNLGKEDGKVGSILVCWSRKQCFLLKINRVENFKGKKNVI